MPSPISVSLAALAAAVAAGAGAQSRVPAPEPQRQPIVTAEAPRPAPGESKSADDIEFLTAALRTDLAMARLGELAAERGRDARVRELAASLGADHNRHADEIRRLLEPLNVAIPTEPSAGALSHHAALSRLTGAEFDAAFLETIVATHTEAIEKYGTETHANPDRALHDFASNGVQMLREHLAAAESLRGL